MIEAAVDEVEAAKRRREYAELTVRREVASAYAKYERAARSMEIFRVGVQGVETASMLRSRGPFFCLGFNHARRDTREPDT